MNSSAFRIDTVSIEGFKGFTHSKEIVLGGKHVILLGPNGFGKSSVVEAIRWGLFGSKGKPNEVILNQRYAGSCRVQIKLRRGEETYTLRRNLLRGATGGTDATMLDSEGHEVSIPEVLPQFETADAGESLHVIYSGQIPKDKRIAQDLRPFERTLYSYWGLTDVPLTIKRIDTVLQQQEATISALGEDVDDTRHSLENEIARLTDQRDGIMENPPWGQGSIPAHDQTLLRIRQTTHDYALLANEPEPAQASDLSTSLRSLEDLVQRMGKSKGKNETDWGKMVSELAQARSSITALEESLPKLADIDQQILNSLDRLTEFLNGDSLATLSEHLDKAEAVVEEHALLEDLQSKAKIHLSSFNPEDVRQCPVCERDITVSEMVSIVDQALTHHDAENTEFVHSRDEIKHRLNDILLAQQEKDSLSSLRSKVETEIKELWDTVASLLKIEAPHTIAQAQAAIDQLDKLASELRAQIDDAMRVQQERDRVVQRLREEMRFQVTLDQIREQEAQLATVQRAETDLQLLVVLGESTKEVRNGLEEALVATVRTALPNVNQALSQAFVTLTQHPYYDCILIDDDILPSLEMLVGSSRALNGKWDDSVLNGQAASALELVPFFAFSELGDMPFEVHLLLLDDPTQAFDDAHIEVFISRLAELGRRVQLIVASHQADLFAKLLPKYFDPNEYSMVGFSMLEEDGGPHPELLHG